MSDSNFEDLVRRAESGDAEAQVNVGLAYEKGTAPGGIDYDRCFKFYKMAADQGDPFGLNNLGVCYEHGYGVAQDYTVAAQLFEESANKGNPYGAANAAHMYLAQLGVEHDPEKILKYTFQGAEAGAPPCLYNLGIWYLVGNFDLQRDTAKAQELIEAAARAGHPMAKDMLRKHDGDLSSLEPAEDNDAILEQALEKFRAGYAEDALAMVHLEVDKGSPRAMTIFAGMLRELILDRQYTIFRDRTNQEIIICVMGSDGITDFMYNFKMPKNSWIIDPAQYTVYIEKAAQLGNPKAKQILASLNADNTDNEPTSSGSIIHRILKKVKALIFGKKTS